MLDVAKERFKDHLENIHFINKDYRCLREMRNYDVIISSLSIHHLSNADKRDLFHHIHDALRLNGVFINLDQIKGPTAFFQDLYWNKWLDHIRANGADESQIQESIQRRQKYDQDAMHADQIKWLQDAGFTEVDCIYKHHFIGVFFALK